ncbi:MAG: FHA domain-containing protein [Myxococcota bacterium]
MSNGLPPARRRMTSGRAPSVDRPGRATSSGAEGLAKLVCTAGPLAGSEFPLVDGEAIIGRANDNAISVPDTSVSRKHVLLRQVGGGWAASDMGSGNGTLVNGEPIAEETVLRNGDVITLGDSEFSFVEGGGGALARPALARRMSGEVSMSSRARPRSPRLSRQVAAVEVGAQKAKRFFRLFGLLVVLIAVSILAIKVYQAREREKVAAAQEKMNEQRRQLGAIFQEGKNLVREGKWKEAKAKFEEMQAQSPDYPTLADYIERANKEIPNQESLQLAQERLEKNELGPAAQALAQVSPNTTAYQKLRELKVQLEGRVTARLQEASLLLDNNGHKSLAKMRQLEAIAADILMAVSDHRDANELHKQAKLNIEELTRPPPVVKPPSPKPWLDVAERFGGGDLAGALSLANECAGEFPPCKALVGQLNSYNEKLKRLESLSVKELSDLLELDDRITNDRRSPMSRQVGTRLAGHYYKSASAAKVAGEWGRAMDFARRTLRADPTHAGAQSIVNELRQKAKAIFLQAYALAREGSDPDEALKLFKDVVSMTPKDDEHHDKAKSWIEKLQK